MANVERNNNIVVIEKNVIDALKAVKLNNGTYNISTKLGEANISGDTFNFIVNKVAHISNNSKAVIEDRGTGHSIFLGDRILLQSYVAESPDDRNPDGVTVSKTIFQAVVDTCREKYNMFKQN